MAAVGDCLPIDWPVGSESETVTRNLDGTRDPWAFFGSELRRVRNEAGMTLEQLGQKLSFSGDMVGKIETCERVPAPKFAEGCDAVFSHLNGHFVRILELARRSGRGSPVWFRPWIENEQEATSLHWWEPLLIPGLLQTADYARALFRAWQSAGTTDEDIEELVSARLERQGILDRDGPPEFVAVLDESVLHRMIGSREIMREQSRHLVEMSERPGVTIQVVPGDVGAHTGLGGAFIIAGFDGAPSNLYAETAVEGQTIEKPALVGKAMLAFDRLRAEALPQGASRELTRKVAEERWTD